MSDRRQAPSGPIRRWPGSVSGRSLAVAYGELVWTVANARDPRASFEDQVDQSLQMLDAHLAMTGSARTHLLSVQVMLTDISTRDRFDALWKDWIGPDAAHWPQRSCFQAALAPGLLVELVVVAAPAAAGQTNVLQAGLK